MEHRWPSRLGTQWRRSLGVGLFGKAEKVEERLGGPPNGQMNRMSRGPLTCVVKMVPLKEPCMPHEKIRLPYAVIITIARLVSDSHAFGAAAIPSIVEEVRSKYPHLEISDQDLKVVVAEFVDTPTWRSDGP